MPSGGGKRFHPLYPCFKRFSFPPSLALAPLLLRKVKLLALVAQVQIAFLKLQYAVFLGCPGIGVINQFQVFFAVKQVPPAAAGVRGNSGVNARYRIYLKTPYLGGTVVKRVNMQVGGIGGVHIGFPALAVGVVAVNYQLVAIMGGIVGSGIIKTINPHNLVIFIQLPGAAQFIYKVLAVACT